MRAWQMVAVAAVAVALAALAALAVQSQDRPEQPQQTYKVISWPTNTAERPYREDVERLLKQIQHVAGIPVLAHQVNVDRIERMREIADHLREHLGSAVIVLGAIIDQKPALVAAVTPDLVEKGLHAGQLVGQLAKVIGGGGGGRPTMAQAGGRDASKLGQALAQVLESVDKAMSDT